MATITTFIHSHNIRLKVASKFEHSKHFVKFINPINSSLGRACHKADLNLYDSLSKDMHEVTNNEFVHFIIDLLPRDNFSPGKKSFLLNKDICFSLGMKFFSMGRHGRRLPKDDISLRTMFP
jgi:hypothetical protein